jgi:ABC-type sugar transport system ATPase subunit
MSAPVLSVTGIEKRFGGVHALEDVSLSVEPGECVALMGGNGAGKSTLVSIISGLFPPDAGQIEVEGRPVTFRGPDDARLAGIETVFQNLALCNNLDASANLFLGREQYRRIGPVKVLSRRRMRAETQRTLADLGVRIPDLDAPTEALSGGQRQALAFARAVRGRSRLLILDEPTAALGVAERRQVVDAVRRIRTEHRVSVLLISHNLQEIRLLADRAVVLRHGRVAGALPVTANNEDALVALLTGSASAVTSSGGVSSGGVGSP